MLGRGQESSHHTTKAPPLRPETNQTKASPPLEHTTEETTPILSQVVKDQIRPYVDELLGVKCDEAMGPVLIEKNFILMPPQTVDLAPSLESRPTNIYTMVRSCCVWSYAQPIMALNAEETYSVFTHRSDHP